MTEPARRVSANQRCKTRSSCDADGAIVTTFGERRAALVETADAAELPTALSALTDTWLAERFASEAVECGLIGAPEQSGGGDGASASGTGVALVAVGGYGRGELCPGSDIDLLLLHDGRESLLDNRGALGDSPERDSLADRLWYPIWDEKLKLGHAVRSLADTLELAAEDIDTATALVDARHSRAISRSPSVSSVAFGSTGARTQHSDSTNCNVPSAVGTARAAKWHFCSNPI